MFCENCKLPIAEDECYWGAKGGKCWHVEGGCDKAKEKHKAPPQPIQTEDNPATEWWGTLQEAREYIDSWAPDCGKLATEEKREKVSPGVRKNYAMALAYVVEHWQDPENWETPEKTEAAGA